MDRIIDSHLHSTFSPDSIMEMEEIAQAAQSVGLKGVVVTDHLDLDPPTGESRFIFDIEEQQREIERVNGESTVELLRGVEIGLLSTNLKSTADYIAPFKFDTIIASLHFIDEIDPYYGDYYSRYSKKEAYGRYLEKLYRLVVEFEEFDLLGHFDYIARYAPYSNPSLLYREHSDILDTLFRYLIENGKALEINGNSYREREGRTISIDRAVLERYLELGGELIALSSDAHSPQRVGENFSHYLGLIRAIGFKYVTHYRERRATPILI